MVTRTDHSPIQPRQPQGTPVGGQFAGKTNPESETELSVFTPFPALAYDDQEDLDDIIPQANSPETIIAVVDAVADGCVDGGDIASAIDMSARQGMYYAEAARSLGLVERYGSPARYALTERGAAVYKMSDTDSAAAMHQVISENSHVELFLMEGEDALVESWGGELSLVTANRRVSTVKSWAEYFIATQKTQVSRMKSARGGTSERATVIVASRQARRSAPVRRCPTCNMELPSGSDRCDLCS